jgi:hypothetical protein
MRWLSTRAQKGFAVRRPYSSLLYAFHTQSEPIRGRFENLTSPPPSSPTIPAEMSVLTDANGSQDIQAQSYVGFDSALTVPNKR